MSRIAALVLTTLLTVGACSSGPPFDGKAYTQKAEDLYVSGMVDRTKITEGCDDAFTNWQCFYDGLKSDDKSRIDVELTAPGDADAKELATKAGKAWMNTLTLAGDEFPDLEMVVVFVNGVDSGTTRR